MKNMEWTTRDRSWWGSGPWDGEPDKAQWTDEATGLPCLIVRGPVGALCGYVGVGPSHPLYRKDYSKCTLPEPCEDFCSHQPDSFFEVHGGITFSGACRDASPERFAEFQSYWEKNRKRLEREAAEFPRGDAAKRIREYGPLLGDFDAWKAHTEATAICHLTEPGDFEPAWWFGFDCAHAWDIAPGPEWLRHDEAEYRTFAYVKDECARLAQQLAKAGQP